MACVIPGCKSHSSRKENEQELLTFHKFPKEDMKKNWINRIGRQNWTPQKHSHICSKHFTLDSFTSSKTMKWRRLYENAVPTLFIKDESHDMDCIPTEVTETGPCTSFPITDLSQPLISIENVQHHRQVPVPMEVCETPKPTTSFHITSSQQESLTQVIKKSRTIKLENELERVKKVSKRRLRKINTLTKRVSRLGKKNEDLYSILIEKLRQEHIETEYITMLDKINENDIIKRFLQKQVGDTLSREYSLEIKKFAVTLTII